jgi:hypothetical protein
LLEKIVAFKRVNNIIHLDFQNDFESFATTKDYKSALPMVALSCHTTDQLLD